MHYMVHAQATCWNYVEKFLYAGNILIYADMSQRVKKAHDISFNRNYFISYCIVWPYL